MEPLSYRAWVGIHPISRLRAVRLCGVGLNDSGKMPQGGLRYNAEAINWEDPTSSAPVCFASAEKEQIKGTVNS